MSLYKQAQDRAGTLGELFRFLYTRKLWWMMPLVFFLILMGAIMIFAHAGSVASWMYPL